MRRRGGGNSKKEARRRQGKAGERWSAKGRSRRVARARARNGRGRKVAMQVRSPRKSPRKGPHCHREAKMRTTEGAKKEASRDHQPGASNSSDACKWQHVRPAENADDSVAVRIEARDGCRKRRGAQESDNEWSEVKRQGVGRFKARRPATRRKKKS